MTGATIRDTGIIVLTSLSLLSGENSLESASGLVFLEPGRYDKVNSKRLKNKAHLACRGFNLLAC